MELLGYVASLLIGLVLGLLGGGGSILSIPILVYLFDIEPVRATAYSLFIVGITSLVGVVPKYRDNLVDLKAGVLFGLPSIVAIFITRKWIVSAIPEVVMSVGDFVVSRRMLLLGLFAILMVFAALPMIRGRHDKPPAPIQRKSFPLIAQGLLIGLLTGLVGAGGGFLIIPALMFFAGLSFKTAAGTSLLIIAFNSIIGFLGDALNFTMDWPFLLFVTLLAVIGIFVGNRTSRHIDGRTLKRAFGWIVLLTGLFVLSKEVILD